MRILIFYGTRPELIKLIPIIYELKKESIEFYIVNVGQHKELLNELEHDFDIFPDIKLDIMRHNQSLKDILVNVANAVEPILKSYQPDLVLVQGDTSTVSTVAMICFYNNIKIGHIEAGLRSYNIQHPFPEEFNRRVVSLIANYNFAPTELSASNLRKEGINNETIHITGNTVVDMVKLVRTKFNFKNNTQRKKILITAHRRENHKDGIFNICQAIIKLATEFPELEFVWPLHPNPNIRMSLDARLYELENVRICEPLNYINLARELSESYIIWTDSGGIQEECPSFKKPVLILRKVTERPEVIESGFGKITDTDVDSIYSESKELLTNQELYKKRTGGVNPFGTGEAAFNIVQIIKKEFDA